jgi:tRNA(adenine34) deaminase
MSDDVHQRWQQLALAQADEAERRGEVPIGAVVVRNGELIASGHNLREGWHDPTAHAELIAMRRAADRLCDWRLSGCTVYVTLEPCAMCAGAMVLARIDRCVFGCRDPKGGFLGTLADLSAFPGLNHRFEVVAGVEEQACQSRLQGFFRKLRDQERGGMAERLKAPDSKSGLG